MKYLKVLYIWLKIRPVAIRCIRLEKNVLGFQFHPEMTPAALALLLEDEEELSIFDGEYVQSTRELYSSEAQKFEQGNQLLNKAIEFVISA